MKKRILSMLLLAVMIVTALPLAVLSVSAAEEETVLTEEDYNALYVQDGLFFAADFFSTKEGASSLNDYIWTDGTGTLSATNAGPIVGKGLPITAGKLEIKPGGQMTTKDYDMTVEYVMDAKTLGKDGNSLCIRDSYFFNSTVTGADAASGTGLKLQFGSLRSSKPTKNHPSWKVGDYWSGFYGSFTRYLLSVPTTPTYTFPVGIGKTAMVMAFSKYVDLSQDDVDRRKAEVEAGTIAPAFAIYSPGQSAVTYGVPDEAVYVDIKCFIGYRVLRHTGAAKEALWLDESLNTYDTMDEKAETRSFVPTITKDDVYVITTTDEIDNGSAAAADKYCLYATKELAQYAIDRSKATAGSGYTYVIDQFYDQSLDTTPYGIDPSLISAAGWTDYIGNNNAFTGDVYAIRYYSRALTEAETLQNHFADLAKWYKLDPGVFSMLSPEKKALIASEFVDYKIGGDAALRDELQAKLIDLVNDVVYGVLTKDDPGEACAAFTELAMELSIDIDSLLLLDVESRRTVYTVVNALPSVQKRNRAMVQSTVDTTTDDILKVQYGAYLPQEPISYKELYVKQDQLVTWVDLFAARPGDGLLYMDKSYPAPGAQAVPQVSGEQKFRDTYVFRDSDNKNFRFGDISDVKFYHTNIREYGDGRLLCGKNNVLQLFSPNPTGSLTYEFVMAVVGNDSPNFQLDAFRLNTSANASQIRVSSVDYTGYGGDFVQAEGTLLKTRPVNDYVKYEHSFNLTITIDRTVGNDTGHYYIKEYRTDANGNQMYSFPRTDATKTVRTSGSDYLYRQEIDGEWYYTCESKKYGTIVVFTENENGKPEYITAKEDEVEYLAFYAVVDGSVDTTPIIYETSTGDRDLYTGKENDRVVTTVKGPYLVNPPREVEKGTEGASPKISYAGMQTLGIHLNGQKIAEVPGMPYTAGDLGWVGNSSNPTFFAVRGYACVLTQEEIDQNHFADLAGYAGFDLSKYMLLSDAQRKQLHSAFASYEVGGSRNSAIEAYEEQVSAMAYDFGSDTEAAKHFVEVCRTFALNTTALYPLSAASRERIFAAFSDVDPAGSYFIPKLQKRLADAIDEELASHYAAALGHTAITFEGWQVRLTGDLGLRALFSTDFVTVSQMEARGITVKTGVLKALSDDADLNDLKAVIKDHMAEISADGEISIDEESGITMAKGYWGDEPTDAIIDGTTLYYTIDTLIPDDEPDFGERTFFYLGFVIVTDKAGETSVFFEETTTMNGRFSGDEMSLYDLSEMAREEYGIVYPNIQRVLNSMEEDVTYVSALVGGKSLLDYKLVSTGDPAALEAFQTLLEENTAVRMQTILSSEASKYSEGLVYLGAADNVYGNGYYGITTVAGNVYLWHNSGAKIDDVLALFTEIVDSFVKNGQDIQLLDNHDYVRRVQ